jgi:serine/threonine protein phosphatase PrpC
LFVFVIVDFCRKGSSVSIPVHSYQPPIARPASISAPSDLLGRSSIGFVHQPLSPLDLQSNSLQWSHQPFSLEMQGQPIASARRSWPPPFQHEAIAAPFASPVQSSHTSLSWSPPVLNAPPALSYQPSLSVLAPPQQPFTASPFLQSRPEYREVHQSGQLAGSLGPDAATLREALARCQSLLATPEQNPAELSKAMAHCQSMLLLSEVSGHQQALAHCRSMVATHEDMWNHTQTAQGLANCQSWVALGMAATNLQNPLPERYGPLYLASGTASRQHPAKVETGIPNADATLEGPDYLGVADGVSGVFHLGLSPETLPWELLESCGRQFDRYVPKEKDALRRPESWFPELIQAAYDDTKAYGATTLILATLRESSLVSACLGDSALLVLRPSQVEPYRLSSIFRTEPGRYDSRRPVQVQRLQVSSPASTKKVIEGAIVNSTPVLPGDVIVLGSDGLFDNLGDDDIASVLERYCAIVPRIQGLGSQEAVEWDSQQLQRAATALVDLAIARVKLDGAQTTLATGKVPANNADDTTALVAIIKAEPTEDCTLVDEQPLRKKKSKKFWSNEACGTLLGQGRSRPTNTRSAQGSSRRSRSAGAADECSIM